MSLDEIRALLDEMSAEMDRHRDRLIELDGAVGDGDLGLTMSDGFAAAAKAAREFDGDDVGKLLYAAGRAMASAAPSSMGTLMASGWMAAGKALRGKTALEDADLAGLFAAHAGGVMALGKAKAGEKTFLDAMIPAADALEQAFAQGLSRREAAERALRAARDGYERTAQMVAVHGRAAIRGEASRSLRDPGAAVAVLMMEALARCEGADCADSDPI